MLLGVTYGTSVCRFIWNSPTVLDNGCPWLCVVLYLTCLLSSAWLSLKPFCILLGVPGSLRPQFYNPLNHPMHYQGMGEMLKNWFLATLEDGIPQPALCLLPGAHWVS